MGGSLVRANTLDILDKLKTLMNDPKGYAYENSVIHTGSNTRTFWRGFV